MSDLFHIDISYIAQNMQHISQDKILVFIFFLKGLEQDLLLWFKTLVPFTNKEILHFSKDVTSQVFTQ